jgi:hypothetical protein
MYINELSIVVIYEFRLYHDVVCDENKVLWQLEHVKNKRTVPLKKLIFNPIRKAYRINSLWVSKNRLIKFMVSRKYKIILQDGKETPFD